MKDFLKKYCPGVVALYTFIYLAWFRFLEERIPETCTNIHAELDDLIPFNEYFIIPYLLWFAYIGVTGLYFLTHSRDDFFRFSVTLMLGMSICLFICTVFPNGTDLRTFVNPRENWASRLVYWIHQADTSTNVFPSIHVFNSVAAHLCISDSEALRKSRYYRIVRDASLLLCVSICLSTVFLKQHSIVDVAGALFLASVIYPALFPSPQTAKHPEYIR